MQHWVAPQARPLSKHEMDTLSPQQRRTENVARAQVAAYARIEQGLIAAKPRVLEIRKTLTEIVDKCLEAGEDKHTVDWWASHYLSEIAGTSMSKMVLDGFETHLEIVKDRISKGARVSHPVVCLAYVALTLRSSLAHKLLWTHQSRPNCFPNANCTFGWVAIYQAVGPLYSVLSHRSALSH